MMLIHTNYLPLSDYFAEFMKRNPLNHGKATQDNWNGYFNNHILPICGTEPLSKICPDCYFKIQGSMRRKGLSSITIYCTILMLRTLLREARAEGYQIDERCLFEDGTFKSNFKKAKYVHYSEPELQVLNDYAFDRPLEAAPFQIAWQIGLNRGEILGLKTDDIDGQEKTILIRGHYRRDEAFYEYPPTSPERRKLPLGGIYEELVEHLLKVEKRRRCLMFMGNPHYNEEHFLFVTPYGPPKYSSLSLIKRKMLKQDDMPRDISLRGLRNQFKIDAINSGCDLQAIRDYQGYISPHQIIKSYEHAKEYLR